MMCGFKYILNGDFKKYLILTIFASLFHTSALFLIPIFFIVREKPFSKKIIILCILFVVGTIFFTDFAEVLAQGDSKYAGYFDLTQIDEVILETNGNVSIFPKTKYRPTIVDDLSIQPQIEKPLISLVTVSYTHLRAHET